MSIVAFFRPLLRTTVVAGIVIGTLSAAPKAPDACALLTVAELSAAFGKAVSAGTPGVTDYGSVLCTYSSGLDQFGVEIWQAPSAAEAQKKFYDELKDSRRSPSKKTTVESGLGEGAFALTMDLSVMKVIGLSAVHGSRFVTIHAMSDRAVPLALDRLRGLMLKALSR
jgi:hypothetical protein